MEQEGHPGTKHAPAAAFRPEVSLDEDAFRSYGLPFSEPSSPHQLPPNRGSAASLPRRSWRGAGRGTAPLCLSPSSLLVSGCFFFPPPKQDLKRFLAALITSHQIPFRVLVNQRLGLERLSFKNNFL